jgi:hypothetical protein
VSLREDRVVRYWEASTRKEVRQVCHEQYALGQVPMTADSKLLIATCRPRIALLNAETGELMRSWRYPGIPTGDVAISPDAHNAPSSIARNRPIKHTGRGSYHPGLMEPTLRILHPN